ncbi:MAG: PD-(D/E)XK nuclease family protein [Clostridium sp.]|uniref:PD-(D/E)XK nuclease family protein n=1 Tax=Clostridium sp. TaxID=1506 RepID=UPI0025B82D95|nr:PD-(D/E)XK nuclease family protein [Clostridium sp.]MCE5220228.1 PD-(D/E)XK nuclease family protein [Clostridium sp.]
MRKTNEELEQIKKDLGVSRLWSWSRLEKYIDDTYGYMLKYILHIDEDRNDSIYAISGTIAHESMENFYKDNLTNQEMFDLYEDKLFEFNTMGLLYDRSDKDKNEKIAKKYEDCMRHYFLNHKKMTNKPIIEPFILIKIGDYYFQGYIDMINIETRDKKKKIIITDFKTSSIYTGKKLIEKSGQLLLYGEGIHQKSNTPYEDIVLRFNFMKYVNVTYTQKKGDKKVRQIERNAIGKKLQSNTKTWLKHFGYSEEEIENYLQQMINTNGIECLPKEVQDTFEIDDCYIETEINEEIISNHKNNIIKTIEEILEKENEFKETKDKNLFWKDVTKEDSYYYANLSGYSANLHMPYKRYLEEFENQSKQDDLLGVLDNKKDSLDLDWLDEILN